MKKIWNVLTIDDEPNHQADLERVLASRMNDNEFIFTKINTFNEGIGLIKNNRFDLIILDVHENSDPDPHVNLRIEDQKGEELLEVIKKERFIPVIFYTGFPQKVEHLSGPFVKIVAKGAKFDEIREAVKYILSTRVLDLLKHIEEQSRSYMWESLSKAFEGNYNNFSPEDVSLLMARNLARNLSQNVVKDIIGLGNTNINPLEMYQFPPVSTNCNPADIYRKNDQTFWMVLTTACDFEQCKAENVLMAKVTPLKQHHFYTECVNQQTSFTSLKASEQTNDAKTLVKKAIGKVKGLVMGNQGARYKFLPGTFFIEDCIVDFQDLVSVPALDAKEYNLVCHLDSPYREEMLNLFSTYYGRIGTPDYDNKVIWNRIESKLQE